MYLQPLDAFGSSIPPAAEIEGIYGSLFRPVRAVIADSGCTAANISRLRLLAKRLPPDAFCRLGITTQDLYPAPSRNFVFGAVSLHERVCARVQARS